MNNHLEPMPSTNANAFFSHFLISSLLLILLSLASSVQAQCVDHGVWDRILKANVDAQGYVNYEGIRAKKGGDLNAYLNSIQSVNFVECNDADRLAFWINAYNAHMVKKILDRPKLKKVSEDFKLFDEKIQVADIEVSLNEIENRVIRSDSTKGGPMENVSLPTLDPRIHFALVCAAVDCPKLVNAAYDGETLEKQLHANAVQFANNPKHVRIEKGKLMMSTLLKWYGDDFRKLGGVVEFLLPLTDPDKRADENLIDAKLRSDYPKNVVFKYDWTVNDIRNKNRKAAP